MSGEFVGAKVLWLLLVSCSDDDDVLCRVNMDFYRLKKEAIDSYVMCFDHFFKKLLPLLYHHMCAEGVTSEMYLMDWNMALFTKALPLEVAAQVWDMYLFEGEMYIMCVGLGILKMFAPK